MTPQPTLDPKENFPDSARPEQEAWNGERELFRIAVLFESLLLLVIGGVSLLLWGRPDPHIAYVPAPILEWAFVGGMVAVLYRAAYSPRSDIPRVKLYTWAVAKPVIGLFMGALVYFLAVGGRLLLGSDGSNVNPNSILWLNALAFIVGFSDKFSIDLINQFVSKLTPTRSALD